MKLGFCFLSLSSLGYHLIFPLSHSMNLALNILQWWGGVYVGGWVGSCTLGNGSIRGKLALLSPPALLIWVIASILHLGLHVWPASKLCRKGYPLMISFEWLSIWGGRGPLLFRNKGTIHPPRPFFSIKYLLNFKS